MNRQRFAVLLMGFSLVACDRPARNETPWTSRDSAGVEVVTHHRPIWEETERWQLDPEPSVIIGRGSDPNNQFTRVVGAFMTGNMQLVVADGATNEIHFYSRSDNHVRTVGRTGEGPSEYRRLASTNPYRGDSLLAFDTGTWTITVLGPDGGYARSVRLDIAQLGGRLAVVGSNTQGHIFLRVRSGLGGGHVGEVVQHTDQLVRLNPDGSGQQRLASFPSVESVEVDAGSMGLMTTLRPLGRNTIVAVTEAEHIVHQNDRFALQFSREAATSKLVVVDRATTPLSGVEREAARAAAPEERPNQDEFVSALYAAEIFPTTLPAWESILVDADGHIWAGVTPSPVAAAERLWDVFATEGHWLGSVSVPSNLTITNVGRNSVVGVLRDSLGVESVAILSLQRPDPS